VLESSVPEATAWDKFCEVMERDIESLHRLHARLRDSSIDVDNASLAEICATKVDWSNTWDPVRVTLAFRMFRKNNPEAEHRVLREKFIDWLDSRGESTMQNLVSEV
jgi:hypothetical protein